jgi:hypothetical protein
MAHRISWWCRLGLHLYPRYVDAWSQAPAPVRCERCGKKR